MNLRRFNRHGIDQFAAYLGALRLDQSTPPPPELIDDPRFTEVVEPTIEVARPALASKFIAACSRRSSSSRSCAQSPPPPRSPLRVRRPAADRPVRGRLLPAQPGRADPTGDHAVVPPAHVLVGRRQRCRRGDDVDAAVDGAGRRLRRHGDGLAWIITCSGVVLTVGLAPHGTPRRTLHTAVAPHGRLHAYVAPSAVG